VSLGGNATAAGRALARNCSGGHRGTLCGLCEDGWAQTTRGCVECDDAEAARFWIAVGPGR
jgi:hypothetical protein